MLVVTLIVADSSCRADSSAGESSGLGRTWDKLKHNRELTVAYFGGSITEGAWASDPNKTSWRALTTAWLKSQFPDASVTEINAAIGGTGSGLGSFRCRRDVLDKHPDLIFIEFAVNDAHIPEPQELSNMEGIVRQIKKALPKTEIIFVYTCTKETDTYFTGGTPSTILIQQRVADHYGIPSVNIGKALSQAIHDGPGTWETLTKEGTHPLDAGYKIYADTMIQFLQAHRGDTPAPLPDELPSPLSPHPSENTQMVDAWEVTAPGWTKDPTSLAGRFPHQLTCGKPGTTIDFPFTGTTVGLYVLFAPDSGMIDYSIDDGPSKSFSSWDTYALSFSRACDALLADDLPSGSHILHLKVSENKDPKSTGTWIRIGAFLAK